MDKLAAIHMSDPADGPELPGERATAMIFDERSQYSVGDTLSSRSPRAAKDTGP